MKKTKGQKDIINYLAYKLGEFKAGHKYWFDKCVNEGCTDDINNNIQHFNSIISEIESMITNLKLEYATK